jgi:hypothetical protein
VSVAALTVSPNSRTKTPLITKEERRDSLLDCFSGNISDYFYLESLLIYRKKSSSSEDEEELVKTLMVSNIVTFLFT